MVEWGGQVAVGGVVWRADSRLTIGRHALAWRHVSYSGFATAGVVWGGMYGQTFQVRGLFEESCSVCGQKYC
ncbi:MAG: hypothetical protein RI897_4102 [Verrucomicrobiota bacterium]